ncbi:MAG: hypothetical protein K2F99_04010 [Muribaculaceae bacterium]|nr:hypothetical protein [Muribaculaceae bacterium]
MKRILIFTTAVLMLALNGCQSEEPHICGNDGLSSFSFVVENYDGADLLNETTPGNILNEITEYTINGTSLYLDWQLPYSVLSYKEYAYVCPQEEGGSYIASYFHWWNDNLHTPVDFNLVIGDNQFPFTLTPTESDSPFMLLMPDGTRKKVSRRGFTVIIVYGEDGVPTVKIWDGNYNPETTSVGVNN